MNLYANVREYFGNQLWAIRPETLKIMADILHVRASGVKLSKEEIQARIGGGSRSSVGTGNSIAVIPLCGVIDQKVGSMSEISGGTAVNSFMSMFRAALADKSVSAIIFDVDSPGGSVSGIQEAADEIYHSRGRKPIIAVADPCIASAAYWIASAADQIVCMPSGMVGSIGIIGSHSDYSKANEMEGFSPTYVTYGEHKAELNSDAPLSDEARAYMQGQVNTMGDSFTRTIAKYRGVSTESVRSDFGKGRMLMAKEALAAKMIDSIGTMEQTIDGLIKGPKAENDPLNILASESLTDEEKLAELTALFATEDFSNQPLRQKSTALITGVTTALDEWEAVVAQSESRGLAIGQMFSKANGESYLEFHTALQGVAERSQAITKRAIPAQASEAVPDGANAEKAYLEFQLIQAREFANV